MYILPAEWHEQDAVILAWPHEKTEWGSILDTIEPVYLNLCQAITQREKLILVVRDYDLQSKIRDHLVAHSIDLKQVEFVIAVNNDIWIRDYGPITLINEQGQLKLLNFAFNGWGQKYEELGYQSVLDNHINDQIIAQCAHNVIQTQSPSFVLEGGAIESDGQGTLLTTKACLLNPNRNPQLMPTQIEAFLNDILGVKTILWLEHGHLQGDDTDSHIDTLVRFAPNNTLVYISCDDPNDSHYEDLQHLEAELKALRTPHGQEYNLIPLPWPQPKYNEDGDRLPASYANYLIINDAVLVPTYRDQQDNQALKQVQIAYPHHEIIGIDCLPLIREFGSLHCMTMQLPKGFLKL